MYLWWEGTAPVYGSDSMFCLIVVPWWGGGVCKMVRSAGEGLKENTKSLSFYYLP